MEQHKKLIIGVGIFLLVVLLSYVFIFRSMIQANRVQTVSQHLDNIQEEPVQLNTGPVSPISGLSCENWNRRPVAVMQPSDGTARPAAGFSQADMVIEMPGFTASVTRLMGVYLCDIPEEMGAIRSSRHDYIHLAKGLDAIFIHWGGSAFALSLLEQKVIDHVECLAYEGKYCSRWDWRNDPVMRMEDSGHVTREQVASVMEDFNFRETTTFEGYPHAPEVARSERPEGGHLRVAFAKPYDVEYDYDPETNSYLRYWAGEEDTDRNTGERLAPKNVVVMMASSEQISHDIDYAARGVQSPWDIIPEEKKAGIDYRYNDVNVGDPWFDTVESGDAYYYMNGQEYKGRWKKSSDDIASKLYFYNEAGREIEFVPGQIWVEILEPGQALRWTPAGQLEETEEVSDTTE